MRAQAQAGGNGVNPLPGRHFVGLPARRARVEIRQVGAKHRFLVRGNDQGLIALRNHRLAITGVEGHEFVQRGVRELGGGAQVQGCGHFDGDEIGPIGDVREGEIEQLWLRDDVLQGLQLGHVVPGLIGHRQMRIFAREPGGLVLLDRPAHRAFSPIVRRQGQMPVTVHLVDGLEIVQRGIGGGDHVPPLVHPGVLGEVVASPGGGDELPQARGMGAGIGHGVVGRLHHGQEREFCRHPAPFQLAHDVVEVAPAALEHTLQEAGTVQVEDLLIGHVLGVEVRHREAPSDAVP